MSFILDALKKSESDRQRQTGPSLFEVKVAPPRRTLPIWAVAIAVLLLINVIVISWMLFRHASTQRPAATGAPPVSPPAVTLAKTVGGTPSSGETLPAPVAANAASATNTASTARGASAAQPVPAQVGGAPAPQVGAPAAQATAPQASSGQPPAASPSSSLAADQSAGPPPAGGNSSDYAPAIEPSAANGASEGAAGALPLYQQIVSSAGLPALHLDLHVYAQSPKDRFVMINMHRLGEGGSLPNGVEVQAIRPDGVVLSYHGTRFLLPRD